MITTPPSGAEASAPIESSDVERTSAASGAAPIEPRLEVNDKNATATLRLLREIAKSGS